MIIATIPPIAAIDVAPISIEYFIGAKNIIPHSTTNRIKKRIKQLDKWLETGELKREEYDEEIKKMNKLIQLKQ